MLPAGTIAHFRSSLVLTSGLQGTTCDGQYCDEDSGLYRTLRQPIYASISRPRAAMHIRRADVRTHGVTASAEHY
jgi:hypothetical protein